MTFSAASLSPRSQNLLEETISFTVSGSAPGTVKIKEIIPAALNVLQCEKAFRIGIGLVDGKGYWFDKSTMRTYVVDLNFFSIVKTLAIQSCSKVEQATDYHEAEEQLIGPSIRTPSAHILYLKA